MYCRKCGRRIDYDALICRECEEEQRRSAESQQVEQTVNASVRPAPVGNRKEGFGKALASTIMGSVSFFVFIIALVVMSVASALYISSTTYYGTSGYTAGMLIGFVLLFASLGVSIVSLIFGIQSIKCFVKAKNEGRAKPVATLVCGIVGIVMSAFTLMYGGVFILSLGSSLAQML